MATLPQSPQVWPHHPTGAMPLAKVWLRQGTAYTVERLDVYENNLAVETIRIADGRRYRLTVRPAEAGKRCANCGGGSL